jgi:hypothetical protein
MRAYELETGPGALRIEMQCCGFQSIHDDTNGFMASTSTGISTGISAGPSTGISTGISSGISTGISTGISMDCFYFLVRFGPCRTSMVHC